MYDVIVIGAGTAGMTAALYALRSGKTVLVLEQETIGGQISFSPRVENFPSIKEIKGSEFSDNLYEQISALGAEVELEKVTDVVKRDERDFTVTTEYGAYDAKSVIIASGVKHRHFNLPNEAELIGHGVSYCAVCDGAFYTGEEVSLIGDGNTALQYSLLLSNYCKKVTVFTLFDKFFGDIALVNALKARENVSIVHEVALTELKGEGELKSLVFKKKDGSFFEFPTVALFVAIGQIPENKVFQDLVELDKYGYIIANETTRTNVAGVYAAGDCRTKEVRQLTTAVADGATAALNAVKYIDA